ncbi:facilitated trehalose transporter Tret1-like [Anticarsia gemmatalis]|uniref:facilitated trehalose transporter Tret1-like n=1 Tax=Anticarsia gemmatalis TaxID=129554 RepID=UPI003F766B1B
MEAWITPVTKQCLVTAGVAMNVGQFGLVMSFTAVLLPQLRRRDSTIPIDETSGSWIAAVPGFALVLGNFIVPSIMGKYGRKIANIISVVIVVIGWLSIIASENVPALLIARLLQGLSMGMSTSLGPILIGEYTSPKHRGPFLSTMGLSMSVMTLIVHTLGLYLSWETTAIVCAVISFIDLIIVFFSPESPSWLADQGRYEECEKVFHWLRGDFEEENELKRMIETSQLARESKTEANIAETSFGNRLKRDFVYFNQTIRKKEFYKPIFIVIHMYMIAHWGGINLLSAYTLDTFHYVLGDTKYNTLMVITLDIQRIISNTAAIFIMRRVKRRKMLFVTVIVNILALAGTGVYSYAKMHGLLAYDSIIFGAILIHIHTCSVVTGSLPLPMVISGEIFPMKYRSLAGGISALFYSLNFFLTVKTVLFLFRTVQFYGAYFIYAAVLTYCLIIAWKFLPETKDRTLQDIEEEFKGNRSPEDLKSAQSLKSLNGTSA